MENNEKTEDLKRNEGEQENTQVEDEKNSEDQKDLQETIESGENKVNEVIENPTADEEINKPSETEEKEIAENDEAAKNENSSPNEIKDEPETTKEEETEEKQETQISETDNQEITEPIQPSEQPIEKEEEKNQEETENEEDKDSFDFKTVISEGIELLEEVYPIEKWNLDNNNNGVRIYSRLDDATGLKMTRGEGVISKPATEIRDVLMDPSATLKWEGNLIENDIVEKTDNYIIIKSLDQKRTLVAQRETLILIKDIIREDGSILVLERSIEHPSFPTKKDCVRAFVHLWACILTPEKEDPNKTAVTFIIFLDPKGWVPKPLFNAVVNGQAMNVQKLKTYIEKL